MSLRANGPAEAPKLFRAATTPVPVPQEKDPVNELLKELAERQKDGSGTITTQELRKLRIAYASQKFNDKTRSVELEMLSTARMHNDIRGLFSQITTSELQHDAVDHVFHLTSKRSV